MKFFLNFSVIDRKTSRNRWTPNIIKDLPFIFCIMEQIPSIFKFELTIIQIFEKHEILHERSPKTFPLSKVAPKFIRKSLSHISKAFTTKTPPPFNQRTTTFIPIRLVKFFHRG